jgi:hypothetical protein
VPPAMRPAAALAVRFRVEILRIFPEASGAKRTRMGTRLQVGGSQVGYFTHLRWLQKRAVAKRREVVT